jgi:integrase
VASIKKRADGVWRARYRDDANKEHARHFQTKARAQQWLDTETAKLVRGDWVDPKAGTVTFRDFAESWRKAQAHRASTRRSVEEHLRLHVYPSIGDRPMRAIRTSDIQGLVRRLSNRLAPGTIEVVYGRVVAVFRAAVRDRLIAVSPCVGIQRPERPSTAILEVLNVEQIIALNGAMPERYRALVLTGAGLGLRPGELFGLAVDRVDFLRRMVRVDQQLVRVRGGVELAALKTEGSYRSVPLPATIGDALAAHLARWPAEGERGLVFTNERGAPIQAYPFSVLFGRARGRAGLPAWVTPHDLRHHYASLLIRSGASVKVVQARLGHKSAKTTLDTYAHLFDDEEDRTRAAVDDAFASLADSPRTEDAADA